MKKYLIWLSIFIGFLTPATAFAYDASCPGNTTPEAYLSTRPALTVFPLAQSGTTGIYVGGDISTTSPYGIVCDLTHNVEAVNGQSGNFNSPPRLNPFSPIVGTGGAPYFSQTAGDIFIFIFSTSPGPGGSDTAVLFFTVDGNGLVWPLSTPPNATGTHIASTNASSTLAKPGDAVTVTFTSDSDVQTPAVTIAGHTAAVATTTGNNFTASTTLSSGDTGGIVSFTIQLTNDFGNVGAVTSTTTDSSSVTFDKTAPALAEVSPIATSTNTTPSYSFTTSEAGTIGYGGSCSGTTTAAVTPATTVMFNSLAPATYGTCAITVTDAAGNASAALAVTPFEIDAPPPAPVPAQSGGGGTITGSGPLSYGYQQPAPTAVILQEPSPAPAPAEEESPAQPLPVTQQVQSLEQKSGLPGRVGAGTGEPRTFTQGIAPNSTSTQAAAVVTAPVPDLPFSPWLLLSFPAVGGLWWGGRKFFGYTIRL